MQQIKFVDLAAMNEEIRERVDREFAEIHKNTSYIGGPQVEGFEKEFANYLGVRHVIGVGSGTDALRLALMALEVGEGDEVITTPMTFIATAASIIQTGAKPVFVDVDERTCNLSSAAVRSYLETHTNGNGTAHKRVILPVHLYGLPANMPELNAIAKEFGALVVEDACQAHGAKIDSTRAGAMSLASAFSFYPGKNLGGWGEGGAVAVGSDELKARIISLRDHGRISHYAHQEIGYNARLDAIQAAVLRAKLEKLDAWNGKRRKLAKAYCKELAGCGVTLPHEPEGYESVYHLFVIRTEKRDAIRQALLENNIGCGIHYPLPLHLQPACRYLGYKSGDFPNAERIADTALSLPMHPALSIADVERVGKVVLATIKKESSLFAGGQNETAACEPPPTCGG
ncbi:MAG TPA: DegT/DnrJ/EryC1/StrS family aminotransferase [Candidatus Binataceae bacterium]|nr:DegT/DnrJ/EryC1/StrS family aminotransferase [Candidatus Binataceae bacterium]